MWKIRRFFGQSPECNQVRNLDREELICKAIKILAPKHDFLAVIGTGAYSDILALWSKQDRNTVAVKIMHPQATSQGELNIWPRLKHQNIVPALKVKRYEEVDIFFMPHYSRNMMTFLEDDGYRVRPDSFIMFRDWLTDILSGLEYLHKSNICHLDLKVDNIMITYQNCALIGDFSTIEQAKGLTDGYALPRYYCPPEAWPLDVDGPNPKVDGKAFDVWSYGMIAFYCFSSQWMEPHLWGRTAWWDEIYPLISKCLNFHFWYQLSVAFPNSEISPANRTYCMNHVKGVLRYKPEDRPTPTEILRHVLLRNGNDLLEPDVIWTSRQEDIQNHILKEKVKQLVRIATLKMEKDKEAVENEKRRSETYWNNINLNKQTHSIWNSILYYCLCRCRKKSNTKSEESREINK